MAAVLTAAAQTAAPWITELDDIDPDYILSPVEYSLFGRLPTELLQIVVEHLSE
jgi:hypothetical protein